MKPRTSADSPIRVDFVPEDALDLPGRLGMTFAPGMKDFGWSRNIESDLSRLRGEFEADVLVSLMEDFEYEKYRMGGLASFRAAVEDAGLEFNPFPIRDVDVPRQDQAGEFASFIEGIISDLHAGKTVVAHCRGGIGRTGTVAACVLVGHGHDPSSAIEIVRAARSPRMLEDPSQEDYASEFAKKYRGR